MNQPYYLSKPIAFTIEPRILKELEMTLIHRLMNKNGWDFPSAADDQSDYDVAVEEVNWYINQLKELACDSR